MKKYDFFTFFFNFFKSQTMSKLRIICNIILRKFFRLKSWSFHKLKKSETFNRFNFIKSLTLFTDLGLRRRKIICEPYFYYSISSGDIIYYCFQDHENTQTLWMNPVIIDKFMMQLCDHFITKENIICVRPREKSNPWQTLKKAYLDLIGTNGHSLICVWPIKKYIKPVTNTEKNLFSLFSNFKKCQNDQFLKNTIGYYLLF